MSTWLRRIRAALGMGLIWALGGLGVGGLIELIDNVLPVAHPFTRLVDMWPQTLAIVAFPHGVLFAIVLGLVGRHRRLEDFTLAQFAAWGLVAGLLCGVVEMALGAGVGFVAFMTLLSTIAGAGSLAMARMAERWGLLGAGSDATRPTLAGGSES